MRFNHLLSIIAVTIILSGCGSSVSMITENNNKDTASNASTAELSVEELKEFTDLFNTIEYNGFLSYDFDAPENIDWNEILKLGAQIASKDCSPEEINSYLKSTDQSDFSEYATLYAIKKYDLADFIKRHTGNDYIPDNKDIDWVYNKDTDSFYKSLYDSDFRYNGYDCISGEKIGDKYILRLKFSPEKSVKLNSDLSNAYYGEYADRIVKFSKEGDDLVFESNKIQWDDHCVPEQTFDVNLAQYDSPVHFVTYKENPQQTEMILVEGGKCISSIEPSISVRNGFENLENVDAVGFFDFNADGMDDAIIVGDTDHGKHLLLEAATTDNKCFEFFADYGEEEAKAIGGDLTIKGMQAALLGDNKDGKYDNYKDAYAQIVKTFYYADYQLTYDLIYVDDDDIPELVAGTECCVSLYSFKDGHACPLMNQWTYGAMGNICYEYSSKNNVIYNGNADDAGATYYNTYMAIDDERKLVISYWTKDLHFIDENKSPSEEELASSSEYVTTTKYYSEIDKDISEDEIKKVIDKYASYQYEQLIGTQDYDSIMKQLAN